MKKLIIILNILIIILLSINIIIKNIKTNLYTEYASYTVNNEEKIELREEHKNKILVYYPKTECDILNKEISSHINNYITRFKEDITDAKVQENIYYTLTITYESYISNNYLSYKFNIEYYTGGAHENHEIWTINYDKIKNKLIYVEDLIKINKKALTIFSTFSRNELLYNPKITNITMLMDGISPKIENFSNFVIFDNEIILFFSQYQVAPYSSGEFIVRVPYNKIFKNKF